MNLETKLDKMQSSNEQEGVAGSPAAKKPKLKQASIFDIIKPKPPSSTSVKPKTVILSPISNNKKRKSVDLTHGVQKGSKCTKVDETVTKAKRLKVDESENEVSSSSEPDVAKNIPPSIKENVPEPKIVGSLDRFVRTTQAREVSTTGRDEPAARTEKLGTDAEKVQQEAADSSQDIETNGPNKTTSTQSCRENEAEELMQEESSKSGDVGKPVEKETDEQANENAVNNEAKTEDEETAGHNDTSLSPEHQNSSKKGTSEEAGSKAVVPSTPTSAKPKRAVRSSSKKEQLQKERQRQREEKEKERQRMKEEKQKEKDAAKAERDRLRKEEKERKEKEKAEQKQAKLEQLQKEKEEKQKKKQAEIDAKNEEKRKKEEEKKRVEDEKKRVEEEKLAKQRQNRQKFKSFFKPRERQSTASPKPEENAGRFIAFQVKENMRLAPAERASLSEERRTALQNALVQQDSSSYLLDLKVKEVGKSSKTWPYEDKDVFCVEDSSKAKPMKAKLLQFQENYRPAYYGTWRKASKKISARKPFGQDSELLDYEVDSDDEWEEEEPGESLSHSEKEDEEGDDDEDDDDGFFVPHGYLSEDEGCEEDEDDNTPERIKARQLAKAKAFEMEMKKQAQVMSTLAVGCIWWNPHTSGTVSDPNYSKLAEFAVQPLTTTAFPIDVACREMNEAEKETKSKKMKSEDGKNSNIQPVPEEAIYDLVRLVHGNCASIQKLKKEFCEFWRRKTADSNEKNEVSPLRKLETEETPMDVDEKSPERNCAETPQKGIVISKRQFERKLKSIAVYEKRDSYKRNCWYVNQSVLEEHKLADLPVPCEWQWITNPGLTPKVDGTPKSGRRTPTLCGTSPSADAIKKFTVKMTPEELAEMMPKPEPKAISSSPVKTTPSKPNIQQFTVKMTPEEMAQQMPPKPEPKPTPKAFTTKPVNPLKQMLARTMDATGATKTPSVSTIPKSVFQQNDGAVPSTSSTVQKSPSLFEKMIIESRQAHYQKKEADSSSDAKISGKNSGMNGISSENECMIIGEEMQPLPQVAPKGQPTLTSLFKNPKSQ